MLTVSNINTRKKIIYNTIGTFFYFFCQWLITVFVVKLSNYSNAGVLSITISMTNIFYMISMYGVRNFQISDIYSKYTDGDYLLLRIVTSSFSIIIFFITLLILDYNMQMYYCMLIYMFFKLGESLTDLNFGYFQKYNLYKYIGISYVVKGILTLVVFCITLYFSKKLFFALFIETISLWLVLIFYDLKQLKGKLNLKINTEHINILLRQCFPLMLYSLVLPYLNFITRFYIEKIYGTEELGYYSSITIVIIIMSIFFSSIFITVIPQISYLYKQKNNNEIIRIIYRLIIGLLGFTIFVIIGSIYLGSLFFTALFTASIKNYIYLLLPTIIVSSVLGLLSFLSAVLISFRNLNLVLLVNLLPAIICTIILKFMILKYGMLGSLYSLLFSLSCGILFLAMRIYKLIKKEKNVK